ncbi:MAG: HypC/HybG/HupF family hydrogenase formation chaperone [Meiothermus sp.]|nr:HypC/HybG/HupF family hydrogenase formation chaperone [Meiothermus sp.]
MCLGIPYEVVEVIDADSALLRLGETTRHCFTGLLDGVREGESVLLHAGQAIDKIDAAEARENLRLIALYLDGDDR